ncbi:MAG: hypothetical protein N2450_06530 [bacterium]|nr:hypothetical protein [bacterium]
MKWKIFDIFVSDVSSVHQESYSNRFPYKVKSFFKRYGFFITFFILSFFLSKELYHSYQALAKQKALNDSLKTEIAIINRKIAEADSIIKQVQDNNPEVIKNIAVSKFLLVRERERLIQLIPKSLQK